MSNSSTTFGLYSLSRELFDIVLSSCGRAELIALARSSKELRDLTLPSIYHTVDLSVHNTVSKAGESFWRMHPNGDPREAPIDDDSQEWEYEDRYPLCLPILEPLAARQQSFLNALLHNPGLGAYVRIFVWTIRCNWDPAGLQEAPPFRLRYFKAIEPDTRICEVFRHLTNVQNLDLCSLHDSRDNGYLCNPREKLFSAVTELRLGGLMYHSLVDSILNSINMPKLQSLDLNALQDQGRPKDSVLAPCSPHGIPIHILRNYNDLVTKDHVQTGPMCGILPALYGHSTTLQSLSIRKPGIMANIDRYHSIIDDEFSCELGRFLRFVKPTLKRLSYEIGFPSVNYQSSPEPPPRELFGNRQFVRDLLPILLEPNWPAIKSVRISGVSWWGDDEEGVRNDMQCALGEAVSLELIKRTEQPCELYY